MSESLEQYFKAGYLATQVATFFGKREINGLLESENIEPVQKVYTQINQELNVMSEDYTNKLKAALQCIHSTEKFSEPLPKNAFDFFYWLDLFHRDIMQRLENNSTEELVFFYGYDYGHTYSLCELLLFVTQLELKLPMQLSYNKQTDHMLRNIMNTRHRLESTAIILGKHEGASILWEQWKTIDALIEDILGLSYMNIEHSSLVQQEKLLTSLVDQMRTIGDEIITNLT